MSVWLPRHALVGVGLATASAGRLGARPLLLIGATHMHQRHMQLRASAPIPLSRRLASTDATSSTHKPSSALASSEPKPAPLVTPSSASKEISDPKEPLGKRVWKKVKHEAQHYWHGSKLLVSEVRIASRLQLKILRGGNLTRRERRQLKRTTQDLLRLIPFAVFVIVPFMELLLPVALKLFPNMLPSTFEDKFSAEEKQRKLLRVRLDMAKFLQETLRESPLQANAHIVGSDAFKEFFRKVRSTGDSPSAADVVSVARLFDDDLTLDNLSRPQLVSMCRYMGINAFGTDNFLRGTIRGRLLHLRRDDQLIDREGVIALSTSELQHACQSRGIRTGGVSPARLREELQTWINLHLQNRVSGVLMVLARAFQFDKKPGENEDGKTAVIQSLENVLSGLPDNLLSEAELEVDSDRASYKQKLEVLQQQEELIEDEQEQEAREEDARRIKREEEAKLAQSLLPDSELQQPEGSGQAGGGGTEQSPVPEKDDARMTTEQVKELGSALSVLSAKSSVIKERDELRALMEENLQDEQDPDKSPSASLIKRIRTMLTKIDNQLGAYDTRVGDSLQLISCDARGRIPVADLAKALGMIKHAPEADVVEQLTAKLDVDGDGFVELEHVLGLVSAEGLGEGLGVVREDENERIGEEVRRIVGEGREMAGKKPRKEDIVSDHA